MKINIKMKNYFYLFILVSISACSSFGDDGDAAQIEGTSADNGSSFSDGSGYSGDPTFSLGVTDPYAYINILRASTGMIALQKDTALQTAASNHALYMQKNGYDVGHDEARSTAGYTGVTPSQRVVHAGYRTTVVGEGISIGKSSVDALDNLMSAIYHRFTLLNTSYNEIGMGITRLDDITNVFVHNVGNSVLNQACQSEVPATSGDAYTGACEPDFAISVTAVDEANNSVIKLNPQMILWPPPVANDVPPAFFEEQPDPLMDYSVSGYPVSVQFNSGKVESASVSQILLFDTVENAYVKNTRMMSETSDPNDIFTRLDYTLFPLERLAWGRKYTVEIEYTLNGDFQRSHWDFTTRAFNSPLVSLAPGETTAKMENGVKTYFYFEPANGNDTLSQYQTSFPKDAEILVDFIDQNTLEITFNGNVGDDVILLLNGQRKINIKVI